MQEIYGKINLKGKDYPFAFKDYVINIINAGEVYYIEDLSDTVECDYIEGRDNSGNKIIFIGCRFVENVFSVANWITTNGVIVLRQNRNDCANDLFDKITFYSQVLTDFYPPISKSKTDIDDWNGALAVETLPFDKSNKIFSMSDYELSFGYYNQEHYYQTVLLSSTPICSFKHNQTQGISTIKDDYLKIYNFLSFMIFSKSVYFDIIKIYKSNSEIGQVYINQRDCNYSPKPNKMIQLRDIPKEAFEKLYKLVTDSNDIWKHYYIPKQPKDVNSVDHAKWITTAACFEGLFDSFFDDFKASTNKDFAEAKSKMLEATDNCLKSLKGKKVKKYAEDCRKQIERYDGLLEEKFKFALQYCIDIIDVAYKSSLSRIGVDLTLDLARKYANTRNQLAHGSFKKLDTDSCGVFYVMHILIYAMILKQSGMEDDKAKCLINKIFG